jgi:membrane-associated protein
MLIGEFGNLTYIILMLVIFCETGLVVTPFLPGDSLIFGIGALAATGSLSIRLLYLLLFMAVIAGDNVNYTFGRFLGPKVFQNENGHFLKKEHLFRTQQFYEKHGPITIIIARFIPIIRTFSPFVAGVGKMAYTRFLLYSIIGGLSWVSLFLFSGYFFGNMTFVKNNFSLIIAAIVLISVSPAVIGIFRARLNKLSKNAEGKNG